MQNGEGNKNNNTKNSHLHVIDRVTLPSMLDIIEILFGHLLCIDHTAADRIRLLGGPCEYCPNDITLHSLLHLLSRSQCVFLSRALADAVGI